MDAVRASGFCAPTLWQALAANEQRMGPGHTQETLRRSAQYQCLWVIEECWERGLATEAWPS